MAQSSGDSNNPVITQHITFFYNMRFYNGGCSMFLRVYLLKQSAVSWTVVTFIIV